MNRKERGDTKRQSAPLPLFSTHASTKHRCLDSTRQSVPQSKWVSQKKKKICVGCRNPVDQLFQQGLCHTCLVANLGEVIQLIDEFR